MPILRPLIGMDKLEITEQAHALGTLRDLHRARRGLLHALHARAIRTPGSEAATVAAMEARLDIERLVTQGVETAEQETFEFPAGAGPYPARGERRRSVRESIPE